MIRFKACPRCQGDLIDGRDQYGSYRSCFQCGRYITNNAKTPARVVKSENRHTTYLADLLAA